MSAIFISHSSQDNEVAAAITGRLSTLGHSSVFLDFDPARGIPAGRSWERELYRNLQACRGVIVLCSRHSMASRWCFAEITHARSLGKHIFPVRIDDADIDPVLLDRQVVDYQADPDDAFARLVRGLRLAGIDASDPMDWDTTQRPPYPGLRAFQEADAPIFFGRDAAIGNGLDLVNRVQRYAGRGLALILGASGSGKSSVMRAGMLPRLRRNPAQWRLVGPVQPGGDPLARVRRAFADALAEHDVALEPTAKAALRSIDREPGAADASLAPLVMALRGDTTAGVLLVLDQLEEVLGRDQQGQDRVLLDLVVRTLEAEAPMVVLATLRSDFLGELQNDPSLGAVERHAVTLGPMTHDDLRQVVAAPAELAGLKLEPGLADALVRDAATDDALPLLAFTLRSLYDRQARDGTLTLDAYRGMGGLAGSVGTAADAIMTSLKPSADERRALRRSFIRMVRADSGHLARQPVRWTELPVAAHAGLRHFEDPGRLLISRGAGQGRTVEVRHEALFRTWKTLAGWLDESRELRAIRDGLQRAAEEWQASLGASGAGMLVHRGGRLDEAERLEQEGELELDAQTQAYFEACILLRDTEREAAERRRRKELEDARRIAEESKRRQRLEAQRGRIARWFAVVVTVAMIGSLALFLTARRQAATIRSRHLAEQAQNVLDRNQELALLLAVEAEKAGNTVEAENALHEVLAHRGRSLARLVGHQGDVTHVAWSPDGGRLLTAGRDGTARIWGGPRGGVPIVLAGHQDLVSDAAWDPRGRRIASASRDNTARIWDASDGRQVALLAGHEGPVLQVAWGTDGERVATAGADGSIRLWNVDRGQEVQVFRGSAGIVSSIAWSPDGRRLASAAVDFMPSDRSDFSVQVWDVRRGVLARTLRGPREAVTALRWHPDGDALLVGSHDGTVRVLPWTEEGEPIVLVGHSGRVEDARWGPSGRYVASAGRDGSVRLWAPWAAPDARAVATLPVADELLTVAWRSDGEQLAAAGLDGHVYVWVTETQEPLPVLTGHQGPVLGVAWHPDPGRQRLATASDDQTARIWEMDDGAEVPTLGDDMPIDRAAWSPDGRTVLAAGTDRQVRIWDAETGHEVARLKAGDQRWRLIAWNVDGDRAAAVDRDDHAYVWNTATHALMSHFTVGAGTFDIAWHPDGRYLAAAGDAEALTVWDTVTGTVVETLTGHRGSARDLAWSPDGRYLASAGTDGLVYVWRYDGAASETEVIRLTASETVVSRVAWSPDGAWLASGGKDRSVRVWRCCDERSSMRTLGRHEAWVVDLEWSGDSQCLATAGRDATVRLWSLDGRADAVLRGHVGTVRMVRWTPDRKRLLSVGDDGTARLWQVDGAEIGLLQKESVPLIQAEVNVDGTRFLTRDRLGRVRLFYASGQKLAAEACRRAVRNLSRAEWAAHLDGACRATCPGVGGGCE